ncbi:hypothetical protein P9A16_07055 [Shinella sp. 838]|uniref:hypothetical protein n=1 Tax=Shinella sp. 838 TaxID=3038164 RepID=UPI0024157D07|nr:hypothetical protein [Shinella sp. 838]MDG4670875.1 hypothetical protein [Shinella sp. 838]
MKITEMTLARSTPRHDGTALMAVFTCEMNGLEMRKCEIVRRTDGSPCVKMPGVKMGGGTLRAVRILDVDVWNEFVQMAMARYREEMQAEPEDAGLRRVLCAGERESLRAAGI